MKPVALLVLLAVVVPPSAAAQGAGVTVDPNSPAGKEYAVPLDQARDEAAGPSAETRGEEHLFGEGIEPREEGGSSGESGAGGGAGSQGGAGGAPEPRQQQPEATHERGDADGNSVDLGQSSAAIEAAAAEGSDGLVTAGIAAGVLVAGLLAGFGLRRLLRSS